MLCAGCLNIRLGCDFLRPQTFQAFQRLCGKDFICLRNDPLRFQPGKLTACDQCQRISIGNGVAFTNQKPIYDPADFGGDICHPVCVKADFCWQAEGLAQGSQLSLL